MWLEISLILITTFVISVEKYCLQVYRVSLIYQEQIIVKDKRMKCFLRCTEREPYI